MSLKSNNHNRTRSARAIIGSKSFIQFVGVIFAIVFVVWTLDAISTTNAVTVETNEIATPEDNDEIVAFALDIVSSLAGYYESIGNMSTDSDDTVSLFASIVYRRGVLHKLNDHMSEYLASENPDIVAVATRLLNAGRELETSFDRIITAMKNEETVDTTLVVVEEIYYINENLFNMTLTSVNAVRYFRGDETPPESHVLTHDEKTYINNHIWDTFGPLGSDVSSTTSSRELIYSAFTSGK